MQIHSWAEDLINNKLWNNIIITLSPARLQKYMLLLQGPFSISHLNFGLFTVYE